MRRLSISAWLLAMFCVAGFAGRAQQPKQAPNSPSGSRDRAAIEPFVEKHCQSCHNADVKKGGFAFDAATFDDVGGHPAIWEKVVRKLTARQMPPLGKPRPDERAYESFISTIESELDRAASKRPNPGRTPTFRRL